MNAYAVVIKPAKAALALFALSIVVTLLIVAGLAHFRAEKEQSILQTKQQLSATREEISKLTYDLASINRLAQKYKRLVDMGFVGEPDRDGWVQRLESIYRDTRLPPTLRYTLAPPQLFNPQVVPDDAPLAYLNHMLHHDLNFDLSGIHDGEFLDVIDKLGSDWKTPHRVETCQISREEDERVGLQIKCTVQIYSLPDKK